MAMGGAQPHRTRFAAVLADILASKGRHAPAGLAQRIGMDPRNLRGRLTGRVQFTPDEIGQVLRAIDDPRLAECLLEGSPFVAAPRPPPTPNVPGATALGYAAEAVAAAQAALRAAERLAQGQAAAVGLARTHATAAQRHLAALMLALPVIPASRHAQATDPSLPAERGLPSGA